MNTTDYFDNHVLRKRSYLSKEFCEEIVKNAIREEVQIDGRIRFWGYDEQLNKYIRVVVLADRKTIHNAFMDRNFKE